MASTRMRRIKRLGADAWIVGLLWVLLYITKAAPGHVSKVWFDQIVVSKACVGPIAAR